MIETLLSWLFSTFVIGPMQAELNKVALPSQAPSEVASAVTACLADAPGALASRAISDPAWAITSIVSVWAEMKTPQAVLQQVVPGCDNALAAAQPYLSLKNIGT